MRRLMPRADWAPSSDASIDAALRLGRCGPGAVVVDLGCGDGRVLEAIAAQGAQAIGLELDVELARLAHRRVSGLRPRPFVIACDVFAADLARLRPDAVLAFLTRAMMQRLGPQLAALPAGTRFVTLDMPMPGHAWDEVVGGCYGYVLPLRPLRSAPAAGHDWQGGVVVHLHADAGFHYSMVMPHPPGPVQVNFSSTAPDAVHMRLGADDMTEAGELAIDVTFALQPTGRVSRTTIEHPQLGRFELFVGFDEACVETSVKRVDGDRCRALAELWNAGDERD